MAKMMSVEIAVLTSLYILLNLYPVSFLSLYKRTVRYQARFSTQILQKEVSFDFGWGGADGVFLLWTMLLSSVYIGVA